MGPEREKYWRRRSLMKTAGTQMLLLLYILFRSGHKSIVRLTRMAPHTDWNGNSPLSDFRSCSHGPVQASSVQTTGNSGKLHVSPGAECTTATESAHSLMRVQLCKQRMVQTCDQRPFHLRVLKNACYWLWHFPSTPTHTPTSTHQPATFAVTNRNKVKCYILFTHLDPWWGLEMTSSHTTGNSKFPLLLIRKLASKHYWWWRWRRQRGWPRCCCWLRT